MTLMSTIWQLLCLRSKSLKNGIKHSLVFEGFWGSWGGHLCFGLSEHHKICDNSKIISDLMKISQSFACQHFLYAWHGTVLVPSTLIVWFQLRISLGCEPCCRGLGGFNLTTLPKTGASEPWCQKTLSLDCEHNTLKSFWQNWWILPGCSDANWGQKSKLLSRLLPLVTYPGP